MVHHEANCVYLDQTEEVFGSPQDDSLQLISDLDLSDHISKVYKKAKQRMNILLCSFNDKSL